MGTWNKTVLIYQFENNMFHLQLGTRNEMFQFYTRVNIFFLPYKKTWSCYSEWEPTIEEQSMLEERLKKA